MSITNVERRALKRLRRPTAEAGIIQRQRTPEGGAFDRESVEQETDKARWTPEQIANFVRRIGPIPVSRSGK